VAFLTALYSFRLIFLVFHGTFRGTHEQEHHLHESPKVMTIPLIVLCVGAIFSGWVGISNVIGEALGIEHINWFTEFMRPVLGHPEAHGTHAEELTVMAVSIMAGLAGIGLAYYMYLKNTAVPVKLAAQFSAIHRILFNKYYVDELYSFLIVRPALWIAKNVLIGITDAKIIEVVVNGVPSAIGGVSRQLRKVQTGLLQHYATIMALGILAIVAMMLMRG
jgi:NADH-quinone oxidoreductase subunit L